MTKDYAIKFRDDYIGKGARDFTKPSHFELDPTGFFEVHVEAVSVTYNDFHDIGGGTRYPKKETIDQFGIAAGISFNSAIESGTRREGSAFIGRSQAFTMGPDGQPIMGDVCEYEFDPEIRAEEDILKNPAKYQGENSKRLKVLEYTKMGRQRANTGARSRATLAVLGIQTGFKDLRPQEVFLFSRVMINTKNKMVAEAQLAAISGHAASLYGPKPTQAIAAPTAEPRRVGPGHDDAPGAPFDPAAEPTSSTPSDQPYREALKSITTKYGEFLGAKAVETYKAWTSNPSITEEIFEKRVKEAINYLGTQGVLVEGIRLGGAA